MVKKVIGLMIVALGVLLLLSNLDIASFDNTVGIVFSLGLVGIGLGGMFEKKRFDLFLFIISVVGGLYFLANINVVDKEVVNDLLGPIIIIAIGLSLLLSFTRRMISTNPVSSYVALFAGVEEKNESPDYQSSEITTIFGGAEVDYRKIKIKGDKAYIDVTVVFGGATIFLPEDVRVTVKGLPIFGGAENKAVSKPDAKKEIIITYTAVFGGLVIKN
jgi:predicted membrane protein